MSKLTGEYDVVVEVGLGLVNAVLGAVHENENPSFPVMPHSLRLFVDDTHRGAGDPVPESQRTGITSRVEMQVSTPTISLPVPTFHVRPDVVGPAFGRSMRTSPPAGQGGVPVGSALDPTGVSGAPGGAGSGGVLVPTIIGPPIAFFEPRVTASLRVRGWVRDATDGRLPEFVHGDLHVTSALVRSEVPGVGTFVTLDRTNGPFVTFQPAAGTGMTDEQRQAVAAIVRNVIRGDTEPSTFRVSLPAEVRRFDFKLQPEARRPCIQLLFVLSSRVPRPGAVDAVPPGLLSPGADFAIGVGREFVLGIVSENVLGTLQESYSFSGGGFSATVRPNPPTFDLEPGRIVFSLTGSGSIGISGGPRDSFTFSVRQAFTLRAVAGGLEPVPDGDPVVDLVDVAFGEGFLEGRVRSAIKQERDAALAAGAAVIREALDVGGQLEKILGGIHPAPAGVTLTGVEIRPEGIVVAGTVGLAASAPVVVSQVVRAGVHDAVESWIPGGTIHRFVWEPFGIIPPAPVRVNEDRFVTPELPLISIFSGFCLRVEGTRVVAGGGVVPVSGTTCVRFTPVLGQAVGLPAEGDRPLVPLTEVRDGRVRVVGHLDPWASGKSRATGRPDLLLCFAERADQAATVLRAAVGGRDAPKEGVLAVAVVPAGGLAGADVPDDLLVVEDRDGRWAAAAGVSGTPACVLLGPEGDVVWKETTSLTGRKVATALGRYAKGEGRVTTVPIRLAVRVGDRPPDVPLRIPGGSDLSLRRLRGRPIVLTFWTSRSEPSLDHLEALRDLASARGSRAPLMIAIGDGETPERAAEVARERALPFVVLADPDRFVSRTFGVWCWPATLWIRPDLRIEAVDFGAATGPSVAPPPGPKQEGY